MGGNTQIKSEIRFFFLKKKKHYAVNNVNTAANWWYTSPNETDILCDTGSYSTKANPCWYIDFNEGIKSQFLNQPLFLNPPVAANLKTHMSPWTLNVRWSLMTLSQKSEGPGPHILTCDPSLQISTLMWFITIISRSQMISFEGFLKAWRCCT